MNFTFEVDDQKISISTEELLVQDTDVTKSASDIAYWGAIVAALKKQLSLAKASYSQWIAKCFMKVLEMEPKLAEWKVRARVESHPTYLGHKKAVIEVQEEYEKAQSVFNAIVQKASSKQSLLKIRGSESFYDSGLDKVPLEEKIEAYKKARGK